MDSVTILRLMIIVVMISAGQGLFKLSSSSLPQEGFTLAGILAIVLDPYFLVAIGIYAACTLAWIWILQSTDLSKAYPFIALSFATVPAVGIIFFGEKASVALVVGIALIITGVVIIARFA